MANYAHSTPHNRGRYTVHREQTPVEGNAREAAKTLLTKLNALLQKPGKHCVLAGGETTCVVKGCGKGGRNQELVLQAGILMSQMPEQVLLLSAGTDGQDGPTDAAGGFADATLTADCAKAGLDAMAYLENNDSWTCLNNINRLLKTGLTGTNVMDVMVGLIDGAST